MSDPLAPIRALIRQGRLPAAAEALDRHLASRPRDATACALRGTVAFEQGDFPAAEEFHRRALKAERRHPGHWCRLAQTFLPRGRTREALAAYEQALKIDPGFADAIDGKADVLQRTGKKDRARTLLERAAKKGNIGPKGTVLLARLLRAADPERCLALAAPHLETLPERPRRALWFEVGKAHDALGAVDDAFDAFRRANDLGARPFDASALHARTATLRTTFSRAAFDALPRSTCTSAQPVFIVGMPRSGSTLVEQILHAHPDAHGAGEIPVLASVLRDFEALTGVRYPAGLPSVTAAGLDTAAAAYLERLHALGGDGDRLIDKTLENYERVGLIALLFPEARIVHTRRHPLDTCLSIFMQDLPPALHPYGGRLEDLAEAYVACETLMTHWGTLDGIRLLDVEYERVVREPEAQMRRLLDFVGLPWNDACLRFHEAKRGVATASWDQVNRPLYATAVARHERYAAHLEPLRAHLASNLPESAS